MRSTPVSMFSVIGRWMLVVSTCALGVAWLAGCGGSGSVHVMPFERRDFPPTEPPAEVIPATEAYWWREGDELNVALRREALCLAGPSCERELLLSLVVEGMPAGRERLYPLQRDALRERSSDRGAHRRSASLNGVAVIAAPQGGRLKGRFHVSVRQQQFTILTGWTPRLARAPLAVMAGTFEAVHDPRRGRKIRARVEADEFDRSSEIWGLPWDEIEWLHPKKTGTAPAGSTEP